MGLTYQALYDCDESEFFNRFTGWREERERAERESWNRQRMHIFYMVSMLSNKVKKPSDVFALPWDEESKEGKKKTLTNEERKAIMEKWDNIPVGQTKPIRPDELIRKITK